MRPARPRRRMAAVAILAVALAVLAACEPSATITPQDVSTEHVFTLCPQAGELPPKDITDRAVEILGARLASLGVEESSITVGACVDVTASTTNAVQDDAVRAAVLGTGNITLLPLDPGQAEQVVVGGAPPLGVEPLITNADIVRSGTQPPSASGGTALTIALSDAGAATLGNWSRLHVGDSFALVVDGVVVVVPSVNEPLPAEFVIDLGREVSPVPVATIEAMIASGPLPPEWAQPELPQG